MKKQLVILVGLLPLLALACGPTCPAHVSASVPAYVDGGDEDESDASLRFPECAAACRTLKRLACEEAQQIVGGLTCYGICAKAEASGNFSLNPKCVAAAATVANVRACGTVRCGAR